MARNLQRDHRRSRQVASELMLTVIRMVSRGPIFSVRRPLSYQVADALILPQPSALLGALVSCLSKTGSIVAEGSGDDYLRNLVRLTRRGIARITVKPLTAIVPAPVILSRLRTLEWTIKEIEERVLRNEKITDAMIREYVFGVYSVYFLFTDEKIAEKSLSSLSLLSRIGDTESLSSASTVERMEFSVREKSGLVDTYTPCDWVADISGSLITSRLCEEGYLEHSLERIEGRPQDITEKGLKLFRNYSRNFYLPLAIERTNRGYLLYKPSAFSARTEEGFTIARFKSPHDESRIVVKEEWLA